MTEYDAYEQSYLNGYAKGYEAGLRDAVKHGHWIPNQDSIDQWDGEKYREVPVTFYKCSECGAEEVERFKYCHCGAKMDGKGGETDAKA